MKSLLTFALAGTTHLRFTKYNNVDMFTKSDDSAGDFKLVISSIPITCSIINVLA